MTKTIVITGASSGIGASAAGTLAKAGWEVAVVGRNPDRTRSVAESVGGTAFLADYDRLDDVRELAASLAARYATIDVLANNAGGLVPKRALTVDGFERTIQHNHLAPFLLTRLLMPTLEASGARVIGTASAANLMGSLRIDDLDYAKRAWFGGWSAYGTSKIATIVFGRELARRGVEAYTFHPGIVSTRFGSSSPLVRAIKSLSGGSAGISPEQGAAPLVHLATAESTGVDSGTYFDRLAPDGLVHPSANREDGGQSIGEQLWEKSSRLVGLEP